MAADPIDPSPPSFILPETVVTPDAAAPNVAGYVDLNGSIAPTPKANAPTPDLVEGGASISQPAPPLKVHDAGIQARLNGYSWPDINEFQNQKHAEASSVGYTPSEIDEHLGYPPQSVLNNAVGAQVSAAADQSTDPGAHPVSAASGGLITPTSNPEEPVKVGDLTVEQRLAYSNAIASGATKGPNDYAMAYTDAVGEQSGHPDLAQAAAPLIAAQLPNPQEVTDTAIGIAHQAGLLGNPNTIMPTDAFGEMERIGKLPGPGFIPGELHLNPRLAPSVPPGEARPFAPGEYVNNPGGGWSSEESMTVEHPTIAGKFANIPSLWLKDGKPYVVHDEDEASELAAKSGLQWPAYDTAKAADKAAGAREDTWQGIKPEEAGIIPPLYRKATTEASQSVDTIKKNVFDMWAATGAGPRQIYQMTNTDPLLKDAITKPSPPSTPAPPKMKPGEYDVPIKLTAQDFEKAMKEDPSKSPKKFSTMSTPEAVTDWVMQNLGPQAAGDAASAVNLALHGDYPEAMDHAGAAAWWGAQMMAGGMEAGPIAKGVAAVSKADALTAAAKVFKDVANDTSGSLGRGRAERSAVLPMEFNGVSIQPEVTALEDKLNRLRTWNTKNRLEGMKLVDAQPPEWRDPKFQENTTHEVETRLTNLGGMPPVAPGKTRMFSSAVTEADGTRWATPDEKYAKNYGKGNNKVDYVDVPTDHPSMVDASGASPAEHAAMGTKPTISNSILPKEIARGFKPVTNDGVKPWTQMFLDAVKPWTDKERALAGEIRTKTADIRGAVDPQQGLIGVEDGYVHGVVTSLEKSPGELRFDPNADQKDLITGGTPSTLSKSASGMKARSEDLYTLQHADGTRMFGEMPLSETGRKMGEKYIDGPTGEEWQVTRATKKEIEANTDIRYQKNFLAGLISNVLRLGRVNRNLDFLNSQAKDLETRGLFYPDKPGASTEWKGPPVTGFTRVNIPQMQGWAHPSIAYPLNDFFNAAKGELENALTKTNRFLMSSLFISPAVHVINVAAHAIPAGGTSWIKPMDYGRYIKAGAQAIKEVATLGPKYLEHLHEGSGLMYGSVQTENYYTMMMNKMFNEHMNENNWGDYARSFGFKMASDMVKTELKVSRKVLWGLNDVMLLQRQLFLEGKGMTIRDAIANSEKDIPNYRVPSEVKGSRVLSEVLKSPNYMNFGRYRYGQVGAIANVVRDIVKNEKPGDRLEAVAKATILASIAMGGVPLIATHGPFSVLGAGYTLAANTARIAGANVTPPQQSWVSAVSSIVGLAPVIGVLEKLASNKDIFGRTLIHWGGEAKDIGMDALKTALQQFYPGQLLLNSMKPGGIASTLGALLGAPKGIEASRGSMVIPPLQGTPDPDPDTTTTGGGGRSTGGGGGYGGAPRGRGGSPRIRQRP